MEELYEEESHTCSKGKCEADSYQNHVIPNRPGSKVKKVKQGT
jgi:hypothetical protein